MIFERGIMIRFIEEPNEKKKISREILESLKEWFEVDESREQYIEEDYGTCSDGCS